MSFILKLLGAESAPDPRRDPGDNRWWGGAAQASVAGVRVDAETALKISTVWACTMLIAETVAMLPLHVYRWLDRETSDKAIARDNPLYQVLHSTPNPVQTSFQFREMLMGHTLLRGNGYARIVPGPRGAVDQLIPLHPDRVTPERLPNGRLRYVVTEEDGQRRPYNQEDIFHITGMSADGVSGLSVIDYARDAFGMTLAAERYGGRFFRNDSRPGGVLRTSQKLSPDAVARLKSGWYAAHSGANQHSVAVLEQGLEWQQIGISPDQAQFLETREFQAEDVCRWFRVPPHMVGLTSKATSWGTGIEQMSIGFVTYTLLPWLIRWQQAISRDLIIAPDRYFAEFVVEGLLKGDIESRYNAYSIGRSWGWLSANDVRRFESMNNIGPQGDIYLQPMNMAEAGAVGGSPRPREPEARRPVRIAPVAVFGAANGNGAAHPDPAATSHYLLQLALSAAGRLIRKEVAAVTKETERIAGNKGWSSADIATIPAWREAVQAFYAKHAALVAETMRVGEDAAREYVAEQQRMLLAYGPEAMEGWDEWRALELAEACIGKLEGAVNGVEEVQ